MSPDVTLSRSIAIALLGKPGAGKSKQAKWLANRFDFPLFDMGALVRKALEEQSSPEIQQLVQSGALISDTVCLEILKQELASTDIARGFIVVGFPRTIDQLTLFDELISSLGWNGRYFVHLDVPDYVAKSRAANRRDKGIRTGQTRDDDSEQVFESRLKVYYEQTAPLVDHLAKVEPDCLIRIDARRSKNREVLQQCLNAIDGKPHEK